MSLPRRRNGIRSTVNAGNTQDETGQHAGTTNQLSFGQYVRLFYQYAASSEEESEPEEESELQSPPVYRFAFWILQMVSLYICQD